MIFFFWLLFFVLFVCFGMMGIEILDYMDESKRRDETNKNKTKKKYTNERGRNIIESTHTHSPFHRDVDRQSLAQNEIYAANGFRRNTVY